MPYVFNIIDNEKELKSSFNKQVTYPSVDISNITSMCINVNTNMPYKHIKMTEKGPTEKNMYEFKVLFKDGRLWKQNIDLNTDGEPSMTLSNGTWKLSEITLIRNLRELIIKFSKSYDAISFELTMLDLQVINN